MVAEVGERREAETDREGKGRVQKLGICLKSRPDIVWDRKKTKTKQGKD